MSKRVIKLLNKEIVYLHTERKKRGSTPRKTNRINILLLSHEGKKDADTAAFLHTSRTTVSTVRRRYVEEGLESALNEKPRSGQPKRYTVAHETELTALACSTPPEGRVRWTAGLLMEQIRERVNGCETVSESMIRLMLKKMNVSLG